MSYDKTIDGSYVRFREEDDYLRCRLQFLQRQRMDIFAPTFIEFINQDEYDETVNILTVSPLGEPSWSNNTIVDSTQDYYTSHVLGNFANNTSTIIGYATADLIEPSTAVYLDSNTGQLNIAESSFVVTPSIPAAQEKKEDEEETHEDPIINRWDILDLRGEDNADL